MAKQIRDFKRISMTAKTATWIKEQLCDKTLSHHKRKCDPERTGMCRHEKSSTLYVAEIIREGMKIGKKRATLKIQCPYSTKAAEVQIYNLKLLCERLVQFTRGPNVHQQLRDACMRVRDEVLAYANRNAMQVIAEAAR